MFHRLPLLLMATAVLAADLRVGIIGTDTSHSVEFTRMLNDPAHANHVPGAKVVAAYKGGSPDLPESRDRLEKYAGELGAKWNVEFVNDIPALCGKVDAILLESVDGRQHLAQARQAFRCGKPVFIDKPLASTLADAREIARLAKDANIPWFSSSALRFDHIVTNTKQPDPIGVTTWGPGPTSPTHQLEMSWYAIHAVEILYALMGTGCQEVSFLAGKDSDVVSGKWNTGAVGSVRTLRPYGEFGAVVFTPKKATPNPPGYKFTYKPLVTEIVKFFQTKQAPIKPEETLEMFAFMDAAQRSKEAGGKPMQLR